MIESFKDLEIEASSTFEELDAKLKEKLGVCSIDMAEKLSYWLKDNAEEIASSLMTLCPFGDYSKEVTGEANVLKFLKEEAANIANWKMYYAQVSESNPSLMEFVFNCTAVNDGEELKGYAYVSKSGKIRHAFAQIE